MQIHQTNKNQIAVKFKNVNFRYLKDGDLILKNINFEIKAGTYNVFIGHNGSGKSTVAKLIANVLKDYQGEIEIFGEIKTKENQRQLQKQVGIVFDNPDFQLIGSTVEEDIIFGLENHQVPSDIIKERVQEVLSAVNMLDYRHSQPRNLSGGQKQKIALATVLANHPNLLIFDEALSMLDYKSKNLIKEEIDRIQSQGKHTIISVTHDMEELRRSDQIFIFNQGQLIKQTTFDQLIEHPEFLLANHLQLPFACQLSYELKKLNVILNTCNHDANSLGEFLCSNSK